MITAFTVKNFKAIGDDPVRIELKPITLLFGANSAGKSSILHALNYAYDVFNNDGLNCEQVALGEKNSLDLGGFKRFIHSGDVSRSVILNFELDFDPSNNSGNLHWIISATTAYVEIEVSWNTVSKNAYVSRYEIGFNGERIVTFKEGAIRYFNTAHPVFSNFWITHGISLDCLVEKFIQPDLYSKKSTDQEEDDVQDDECKTPEERRKAFERLGRVPSKAFRLSSSENNINLRLIGLPWKRIDFYDMIWRDSIENNTCSSQDFEGLFKALLVRPAKLVADWLKSTCYIGPLREIPPRNFAGSEPSDYKLGTYYYKPSHSRWATGLAAWDQLYSIGKYQEKLKKKSIPRREQYPREEEVVCAFTALDPVPSPSDVLDDINDWLVSEQRLNTGYRILFEHYREILISISPTHPLFVALASGQSLVDVSELANEIISSPEKIRIWLHDESRDINLTPHEIGTGISQVLPIVVAAVGINAPLVAIEQPELHIHPALQARLGDLFIENIKNEERHKKSFLIETHSEHLLLRLLRRINETYENRLPPDITPCTPDDVAIYYLEKESQGLRIRRLEISEDGDSKGDWPEGFFEERRAELF